MKESGKERDEGKVDVRRDSGGEIGKTEMARVRTSACKMLRYRRPSELKRALKRPITRRG